MAVVCFTSNASTGAGSLVEAIANAQPGDVIRPDESVFERGSTIEIVLASQLNVDKDLTLDASPFRVRLNGGGTKRGAYVAIGVVAEFTAFDFVACYSSPSGGGARVETSARATFNRCLFAGCDSTYGGGLAVQAAGNATLNDCAVVGCRATVNFGGGVYASGDVVLNGVTAIGCASPEKCDVYGNANVSLVAQNSIVEAVQKSSTATFSAVGSVVGVPSSTVGFVASPPDDLTVENWNANAWQNWDLRLLDDASGAPSPYRDSGDVGAMSRYDLDGNFRGRETNGVATCSPGAYETIQADLFWIGRDATGAEVVSPSFLTSDGWAASRFATVAGDVAPSNASSLFVGANVAFVDVMSNATGLDVIVGGGQTFVLKRSAVMRIGAFTVGAGASVKNDLDNRIVVNNGFRFGSYANLDAGIQTVNTWSKKSWSDENVIIKILVAYAFTPSAPLYGTLVSGRTTTGVLLLDGAYRCARYATAENSTGEKYAVDTAPGTTIRCRIFEYPVYSTGKTFTNQVTVKLYGEATAKETRAVGASLDASDDFVLDVTEATSATLTLNGQTVYGDAPTCAVALTGTAKIGERGLDVASLTLAADATLTVDGARGVVAELSVADGATVAFSGVDATLTATETATVGAASFTGIGYFATPPGTGTSSAAFAENVRNCDYGANVSSFSSFPVSTIVVNLSWVKQNQVPCVLIEEATGSEWNIVNNRADGESLVVDISAPETYRLFDGENFFTTSASPYGTAYELAEEQTIGYLKTLISTGYLN